MTVVYSKHHQASFIHIMYVSHHYEAYDSHDSFVFQVYIFINDPTFHEVCGNCRSGLFCMRAICCTIVASWKSTHGRSTLQVCQRGGWALFQEFMHLLNHERARVCLRLIALELTEYQTVMYRLKVLTNSKHFYYRYLVVVISKKNFSFCIAMVSAWMF